MYILLVIVVLLVLLDYGLRWREGTTAHSIAIRTAKTRSKKRLALIVGAAVFVATFLIDGLVSGAWGRRCCWLCWSVW